MGAAIDDPWGQGAEEGTEEMTEAERELLRALSIAVTTLVAATVDQTGFGERHLRSLYDLIRKAGFDYALNEDGSKGEPVL
jgi:hypothetical protein